MQPTASVIVGNVPHRTLSERPALAVLVSEAIASWANVETFLLELFVEMLGGNASMAARIYLKLEIRSAKTAAITEAIDSIADPKLARRARAIVQISKSRQKERDKLAHHQWGISLHPALNDALLLVDPKTIVGGNLDPADVYVYRASDLQNIIDANDRLCGYGQTLLFILRDHPANRGGQLYEKLCNESEIRDRLDRLA